MGNGIGIIDKNPTINLVKQKGVKLMPLTKLVEVTKKGAKVQNVETGEEQLLECDTVLLSLGVEANTKLYDEVVKAFPNAKLIGDATTPAGSRPWTRATKRPWRSRRCPARPAPVSSAARGGGRRRTSVQTRTCFEYRENR